MRSNNNYRNFAIEFAVVVVGVAIALAADNWRESIGDRATEREYFDRLVIELNQGLTVYERELLRVGSAAEAASFLADFLENPDNQVDPSVLTTKFIEAARTGGGFETWRHDITYQELVSTGNLNLIRDTALRTQIGSYYARIYALIERRSLLSQEVWIRFREITGFNAGGFLSSGESLPGSVSNRLLVELEENLELADDFRLLRAQLLNILGRLESAIELNKELVGRLRS